MIYVGLKNIECSSQNIMSIPLPTWVCISVNYETATYFRKIKHEYLLQKEVRYIVQKLFTTFFTSLYRQSMPSFTNDDGNGYLNRRSMEMRCSSQGERGRSSQLSQELG